MGVRIGPRRTARLRELLNSPPTWLTWRKQQVKQKKQKWNNTVKSVREEPPRVGVDLGGDIEGVWSSI